MEPDSFEGPPKYQALANLVDVPRYKNIYYLKKPSLWSDLGSILGNIVLFLIIWYLMAWVLQLILSLLCIAIVIVVLAVAIFRIEVPFEAEDIMALVYQAAIVIANMVGGTLVLALSYFSI